MYSVVGQVVCRFRHANSDISCLLGTYPLPLRLFLYYFLPVRVERLRGVTHVTYTSWYNIYLLITRQVVTISSLRQVSLTYWRLLTQFTSRVRYAISPRLRNNIRNIQRLGLRGQTTEVSPPSNRIMQILVPLQNTFKQSAKFTALRTKYNYCVCSDDKSNSESLKL